MHVISVAAEALVSLLITIPSIHMKHLLNTPIAQIPQCTSSISQNATFCNRNMHISVKKWSIVRDLMNCGICEMSLEISHDFVGPIVHSFNKGRSEIFHRVRVAITYNVCYGQTGIPFKKDYGIRIQLKTDFTWIIFIVVVLRTSAATELT